VTAQISKEAKQKIDELCRKYKVKELSLFGSRVRGEATDKSDFDFLVDFLPDARMTLFEFSGMQLELQDMLGEKVDLVPKNGLKPRIKDSVLAEAQVVYEG
jgi:predicted nucleotidyltransferase